MHYDLGELGRRFVGRDGQVSETVSALPLPRALLADPIVNFSRTPGGYAWLAGEPPRPQPLTFFLPHAADSPSRAQMRRPAWIRADCEDAAHVRQAQSGPCSTNP